MSSSHHSVSEDGPKVELHNVGLMFDLHDDIIKVLVSSNKMHIATRLTVYRFDLNEPSRTSAIEIPKSTRNQIKDCWIHPLGVHFIVRTTTDQYLYLHLEYSRFKILNRLKGIAIKNVTFRHNFDYTSTEFVILDEENNIHVSLVRAHLGEANSSKRDDKFLKHALSFEGQCLMLKADLKYMKLGFANRLLQWPLSSSDDLFSILKSAPRVDHFKYPLKSPISCSTSNNFYFIDLESGNTITDDSLCEIFSSKLIPEPISRSLMDGGFLFTTEYHLAFLAGNKRRLTFVDKLKSNPPIELNLASFVNPGDTFLGSALDGVKKTSWIFTKLTIFEIRIKNEVSNLWKPLCDANRFDDALLMLDEMTFDTERQTKKKLVLAKYGYYLLQRGHENSSEPEKKKLTAWSRGLRLLAELNESIDKVFMTLEDAKFTFSKESSEFSYCLMMVDYLKEWLRCSGQTKNTMKRKILSSWILHLFLRAYGLTNQNALYNLEAENLQDEILESLSNLLKQEKDSFDRCSVINMLSKANMENIEIEFAVLIKDYLLLLKHSLDNKRWKLALEFIHEACVEDPELGQKLASSSALILLINCPSDTIKAWSKSPSLNHVELLPAILLYQRYHQSPEEANETILEYLKTLIFEKRLKDSSIIESYLSTLIQRKDETGKTSAQIIQVFEFLNHDGPLNSFFDTQLMLRLCIRFDKTEAAVHILVNGLEKYDLALDLALQKNRRSLAELVLRRYDQDHLLSSQNFEHPSKSHESARFSLSSPARKSDKGLIRKRLWIQFSSYLVKGIDLNLSNDSSLSLASYKDISRYILQKSDEFSKGHGELTLKDLLPLFPESVCVSDIKEEIIDTLRQYQDEVNHLTLEMKESIRASTSLRAQALEFKDASVGGKVGTILRAGDSCPLCQLPYFEKTVLVFPNCQHAFHKECMVKYYLKLKGDYKFKRVVKNSIKAHGINNDEIDDLITKQCILCHDIHINRIGTSLREDENCWAL